MEPEAVAKIKDRTKPVKKRLKYIKTLWKSETPGIAQKEQFVIDCLGGLLLNKKREKVSDEDIEAIWKCLYKCLQTESVSVQHSQGYTIPIKPSLAQILTDNLVVEYEKSCDSSFNHVTGCCLFVIKSTTLSHVFVSSYKAVANLLSAVLEVVIKHNQDGQELSSQCLELLHRVSLEYQTAHRVSVDSKMVLQNVTSKLMVPILTLHGTSPEEHPTHQCAATLLTTIENTIFDKGLIPQYEKFLNNLGMLSHPNKTIEQIMMAMSSLVDQKADAKFSAVSTLQQAGLQYIPRFYKKFISRKCHKDSISLGHKMLLYLLQISGINPKDSTLTLKGVDNMILKAVYHFLKVVYDMNLYNVAQDNASGGEQLKSYQSLVSVILNVQRCEWFYCCLEQLLKLNHLILEPRIIDALKYSWLRRTAWGVESEVSRALGSFLSCLLLTYSKLRQWGKWLEFVLTAVQQASDIERVLLPEKFLKCMAEVVELLPQSAMIELWHRYQQELKEQCIPKLQNLEDDTILRRLAVVTELFYHYLSFIKVADHNVTAVTSDQVKGTLVTMTTDIVLPLLDSALLNKNCDMMSSGLVLCKACAELHLLLARYTGYNTAVIAESVTSGDVHIGCLVPGLTSEKWKKIHKFVKRSDNGRLIVQENQLLFLTMQAVLITHPANDDVNFQLIKLARQCVKMPRQAGKLVPWDGRVLSINQHNYLTAIFSQAVHALPVCSYFLKPPDLLEFVDFMLRHEGGLSSEDARGSTLDVADIVRELPVLQSCVISSCLTQIREILSSQITLLKKKMQQVISPCVDVINMLANTEVNWCGGETDSSTMEVLLQVSQITYQLMKVKVHCELDIISQQGSCMKHLMTLPLAYLSDTEKLRCILSVVLNLILITVTKKRLSTNQSEETPQNSPDGSPGTQGTTAVFHQGLRALVVLVESCDHTLLFKVLDMDDLFQWLMQVYCWAKANSGLRLMAELLIGSLCKTTVKDLETMKQLGCTLQRVQIAATDVNGSTNVETEAKLVILTSLYQELYKVSLNRGKEEMHSICKSYLSSLSTSVQTLVTHVRKSELSPPCKMITCCSLSLQCWSNEKLDLPKKERKNSDWVLQKTTDMLHGDCSIDQQIEALCFLNTLCEHSSRFEEVFFVERKLHLINLLRCLLMCGKVEEESEVESMEIEVEAKDLQVDQKSNVVKREDEEDMEVDETNGGGGEKDMESESSSSEDMESKSDNEDSDEESAKRTPNVNGHTGKDEKKQGSSIEEKGHSENDDISDSEDEVTKVWKKTIRDMTHQKNKITQTGSDATSVLFSGKTDSPEFMGSSVEDGEKLGWKMLRSKLIFDGRYEVESHRVLRLLIPQVIAHLITALDMECFKKVLVGIVMSTTVDGLLSGPVNKIHTILSIWSQLIQCNLTVDQGKVVNFCAQEVAYNLVRVMLYLAKTEPVPVIRLLDIHILRTLSLMMSYGPALLFSELSTFCLQCCTEAPLDGDTFIPTFHVAYSLVDNYLLFHTKTALSEVTVFRECTDNLMTSVIREGNQDKLAKNPQHVPELVRCAQMMDRLYGTMMNYKSDFSKNLVQIVKGYVTEVQQVTLHPEVKRSLVPAIYKVLEKFNRRALKKLREELTVGLKEVFKALHEDYDKYYRYKGKV